jgi:hypothetical protein
MMKQLGQGASTKWIIPMDLAAVAGPLGEALGGLGRNGGGGTGAGAPTSARTEPPAAAR